MSKILFSDLITINPDKKYMNLSKEERIKLIDDSLKGDKAPKGLKVNLNISHSAKVINARIYTPKAHLSSIDGWVNPFAKPVLLNHDMNAEPLGRVQQVTWKSLEDRAIGFFKSLKDFQNFVKALDSGNAKAIYRAFKNNNLLGNRKFPGLGVLVGDVRITDALAIEKFIDGRYLTVSAGQNTNSLVCGICGSDWAMGDVCKHERGEITEDGDIGVFITGDLDPRELSVVNGPADNEGFVNYMEMSDSENLNEKIFRKKEFSNYEDIITDSEYILGEVEMKPKESTVDSTETTLETKNEEAKNTEATVVDTTEEKVEVEEKPLDSVIETAKEVTVDFLPELELLDLALEGELLKDKELVSGLVDESTKQTLTDECFYKNRKILVNDHTHVVALKRLLGKVKISDALKVDLEKFLGEKESFIKDFEHKTLLADYKKALEDLKVLKEELNELKEKLDKSTTDAATIEPIVEPRQLENPSVDSSDSAANSFSSKKKTELGKFEQNILDKYLSLLKDQGELAAKTFLHDKKLRGHIPKNFDPTKYLTES